MASDHTTRLARIHASAHRTVLVVTGGGTQAIADLLAVPGASRTVLEAVVPYSEAALTEFLGASPRQAVSVETAAALARAAYKRAVVITRYGGTLWLVSPVPLRWQRTASKRGRTAPTSASAPQREPASIRVR